MVHRLRFTLSGWMGPTGRRKLACVLALPALLALLVQLAGVGLGQEAEQTAGVQAKAAQVTRARRFLRGRNRVQGSVSGGASAAEMLAIARARHVAMAAEPRATSLGTAWVAVGPGQVVSASYGAVTGRVTAVALDPADATGNTIYVGTTGGGVWKSTNAAGPATAVTFAPLTDDLPVFSASAGTSATASLSIGALAVGNGVLLAGTGDPNDATDSYYGSGVLRSTDGGTTWTLAQVSRDGVAGNHSFFGLSFAGFAFSSANPSLIVAAVSQAAEGVLVNAPDLANSVQGLYFSTDAGVTWQMASIYDGSQPVQTPQGSGGNDGGNAATAVVWNPLRQRFYAAVRFHGYYDSADGQTWTRLVHQPGTGLTTTACPANPGSIGSANCPIFRGALAAQASTGDMFALTVNGANVDQGLWQDACGLAGSSCGNSTVLFGTRLGGAAGASPLESAGGVIQQGDYNLALTATASGTDTVLYAGTIDLFRCSLAGGCVLRNTTNAQNGCTNPAGVAGAQHAIATLSTSGGPLVYVGNDGGIYRSSDGANEMGPPCSVGDAGHFQNLNLGMGSLAEVVSFAQDPVNPTTLLVGLGALGTAGTGSASTAWPQLATGEGGTVAIDATTPANWFVSTGAGVSIARCTKGAACAATDFAGPPAIGAAQVSGDASAIDSPWVLDPGLTSNVFMGTCRAWRGPATGVGWPGADTLSQPFGSTAATACGSTTPVVRSVAAGGAVSMSGGAQSQGSQVLYAGLAGTQDGGGGFGGHLFSTVAANTVRATTAWRDVALGQVTNDKAGVFNPGNFDISSVAVDPHDATGATVYATVMGFTGNGVSVAHVYLSNDGGAHWTNISSNLPNAPANSVVVDPNDANTVYVAMDTGVYVTTGVTGCASANCWSVYGAGLPNSPVVELEAAAGMATGDGRTGELRAATYGRGIWQIPLLNAVSPAAPGLAVSPAALTFASQQVGTLSAAQTVTVMNSGTASLTVSSVTASGDFNQTNTCTAAAIATGGTCAVQVSFLPSAPGGRTGTLTVFGNAPGGQATVALNGTATAAAAIVLTPVALTFAATNVGATSAVQNITVSNTGGTTATLTSETVSGDFTVTQNTCGAGLGPQSGCTISVAFAPTATGARTGTLTVTDSAGMQAASLSGTGTAAATDGLTPASLTFGAQALNTASAMQAVMLTNNGDVALTLIAAQIPSGDFTVVNGCGNSLNGHSSCVMSVAFAPKALGGQSGVLTVSDQFRTQTVALNGTGVAPAGVSLAPVGGLSFGATALGQTAATQTVTLTNNGGQTLTVSSLSVSGDFFVVAGTNTCGATVAAGGACTVGIGFTPTMAGAREGVLAVTSNAAGSPQMMALSGIGVDFSLTALGPTSETVTSGQTASYLLLLSSGATVAGNVAFTCSGAPANAVCTMNPSSAGLGGITTVTVTIATGTASSSTSTNLIWVFVPIGLVGFLTKRRRGVLVVLLGVAMIGLAGCGAARLIPYAGGGGGGTVTTSPTPGGTYAITVTGKSAGLMKTVGLTLVVQ